MNKLDELDVNVTVAIRKVEEAQTELAHAELAIAKATSWSTKHNESAGTPNRAIKAIAEVAFSLLVFCAQVQIHMRL